MKKYKKASKQYKAVILALDRICPDKSRYVSAFVPAPRFGIVTSNLVEQMNSAFGEMRHMPILKMLLGLDDYVQSVFKDRKSQANEFQIGATLMSNQETELTVCNVVTSFANIF